MIASPEPGRESVRFVAEDPTHRARVHLGSRMLIGMASYIFSLAGRADSRGLIHAMERQWSRAVAGLLRLRLDTEGLEHIDHRRKYVVVSLHESLVDPVALIRLGLPLRFLVRDELFEWPALGRYLRATSQIKVDERSTRSSLRILYRAIDSALSDGDSLAVFAQGSVLGVEIALRHGAFRIARRFGIPVLPVVITGSHRVWEHPYSATVRLDQRVSMRVMPALSPSQLDAETVRDVERRMKGLAVDPSTAPARRFDPDRDGWWDDYRYEIDPDFAELAGRLASRRSGMVPDQSFTTATPRQNAT